MLAVKSRINCPAVVICSRSSKSSDFDLLTLISAAFWNVLDRLGLFLIERAVVSWMSILFVFWFTSVNSMISAASRSYLADIILVLLPS